MKKEHNNELERVFGEFMKRTIPEWAKITSHSLSFSQYIVLQLLIEKGPQKMSDLAKELNITLSAMTGLSDKLIGLHYAERIKSKEDRRVVRLEATDEGKKVAKKITEQRKEKIARFYDNLTEEEVHTLIQIYKKVLGDF